MMGLLGSVMMLVCAATFVAVIAGLIFHKMIGWYIEGNVGAAECVMVAGLFAALVVSLASGAVVVSVLIGVGLAVALIFPVVQSIRISRELYDEQIERFRQAIESDPDNLAARSRLAQTLYKKGRLDEAIVEMSEVVNRSPQSRQDAYLLKEYLTEKAERQAPPVICPSCGHRNPPERTHCYHCEGFLRVSSEFKKWLLKGGLRGVVIYWAGCMAVVTGIMLGLSTLPAHYRIGAVGLFLIAALVLALVRLNRSY